MKRKKDKDIFFTMLVPPSSLCEAFSRAISPVPEGCEVTSPRQYHMTLNELQIPKKRSLDDLCARLSEIEHTSFDMQFTDIDLFERMPRRDAKDNVAWLRPSGVSGMQAQQLHKKIHMALRPAGYNVGRIEIRPHLTCLKVPFEKAAELERWMKAREQTKYPHWPVDCFYLVRGMYNRRTERPQHEVEAAGKGFEIIRAFKLK